MRFVAFWKASHFRKRLTLLSYVLLAIIVISAMPDLSSGPVLAQSSTMAATGSAASLPPCSAAGDMRQLQTPVPVTPTTTPTVDPNAPSPTPRPPTATPLPAPSVDRVGFPKDYQTNFKLMYIFDRPDNKSLRVICGNEAAASWQPGQPFAEGSIMTMDVYRTLQVNGKPVLDSNGHYIRTQLNGIFVMRKEPGFGVDYKEFRNGDWEYAAYRLDGSLLNKPQQTGACAACHLAQAGEAVDYTFRMNLFPLKDQQKPTPPDNTVIISAYAFFPQKLTVKAGTTVTWINKDEAEFIITAKDGSFGSKKALKSIDVMPSGDSYSFKFDTPGTYDYFGNAGKTVAGTIEVIQ